MNFDGLERLINGKINDLKNILETSTYGEIKSLNSDSINVYLPQRDVTLPDVPVFTLQGGGEYIQFPLKVGDKVLISFTKDSALDWLSGNNISSEFNFGLENAFALVGLDTLANPLPLTQITTINVKDKIKIQNSQHELIDLLVQLNDALIAATTLTIYGAQPLVNRSSFVALKPKLESFKG